MAFARAPAGDSLVWIRDSTSKERLVLEAIVRCWLRPACLACVGFAAVSDTSLRAAEITSSSVGESDAAAAAGETPPGSEHSPPVAWINGEPIPSSVIERAVAEVLQGKSANPEALTKARAAVLQKVIEERLFLNFLKAQRIPLKPAEVDAAMAKVRQELAQQKLSYDKLIASGKLSEEALRYQIAMQLSWEKFVRKHATEEHIEEFYKDVHEQFDGSRRRVSHIVMRPSGSLDDAGVKVAIDEAQRLQARIAAGKITFEDAVKKYSSGPSRRNGGDIGYVTVGGGMSPDFENAVFQLRPGDVSTPVVTGFGVHLIKVTDVKPGNKTWRDVSDKLLPALANRMRLLVLEEQFRTAKIEFAPNVPHFRQGTAELVVSPEKTGGIYRGN